MDSRVEQGPSPYRVFSRAEWARLRRDAPMTLTPGEVTRLQSVNESLSVDEVETIYLPISRLLGLYVSATQKLFHAQQRFLGITGAKMPYIIGIAGSVAVGKSTTARVLQALLMRMIPAPVFKASRTIDEFDMDDSPGPVAVRRWCAPPGACPPPAAST